MPLYNVDDRVMVKNSAEVEYIDGSDVLIRKGQTGTITAGAQTDEDYGDICQVRFDGRNKPVPVPVELLKLVVN